MKFTVLAGYLLALTIVGFFLWLIRGFVRGLRRQERLPGELAELRGALSGEPEAAGRIPVDWPLSLLYRNDDIEYPGCLEALTPAGAFLRSSAPLQAGQEVSLYLAVPGSGTCRVSATVLWVGKGDGRQPLTQVRFERLGAGERERLLRVAADSAAGNR